MPSNSDFPPLSQERVQQLTDPARNGPIVVALALEILELREDRARLDHIESLMDGVAWRKKGWLWRGDAPEIVPANPGEVWPDGVVQPTAREAIDAARRQD